MGRIRLIQPAYGILSKMKLALWQPKSLAASPRSHRHSSAIILLIIGIGIIDAVFVGISTDLRSRAGLVGQINTAAAAIPASEVLALKGDPSDVKSNAYKDIKQRLIQIKRQDDGIRFAYLMGKRGQKVFFFADSEDQASPDYSAPGDSFDEASPKLIQSFANGDPFMEGPIRDQWGVWLSALSPVIDAKTNNIVAMIGIDVPATGYYQQIILIALVPLLLAAIPIAGLLRDRKVQKKEWEIAQLKSQFVSIASHELRSPLSGMLWAIESLLKSKDTQLTGHQQSLLQDMYRSTEASVATINEILDLSIFERGKQLTKDKELVDLVAVINDVRNTLSLSAKEKELDVIVAKTWPRTAYTEGDVASLKRAFMNILANAIKYSPTANVVTVAYRTENKQHIVGVLDHGIGIPKNEQAKVFEGYYRAANATKSNAHGTGLGLFLSRVIIEEHKGRIWIDSAENQGTAIFVALPIKQPNLAKPGVEPTTPPPDGPAHPA